MMLPTPIDNTDERLDALLAVLVARLPTRQIKRGFQHYSEADDADLETGILRVLVTAEDNYANGATRVAQDGATQVSLIGHLKIIETDNPEADSETLERAELAFVEEIKAAFRQGHQQMHLRIEQWGKSMLDAKPYGWIVVQASLSPPQANTH